MTTTPKFYNSKINLDITSFSFIFLIYHLTAKSVHPEQHKVLLGRFFRNREHIHTVYIHTQKKKL